MTSSEPPQTPRDDPGDRDFLDWSENQQRSRRSMRRLDSILVGISLLLTAALVIAAVWLLRHV